MYTMDCKDPNCDSCKQDSKGLGCEEKGLCKNLGKSEQSSEKGNQCEIPETLLKSIEEECEKRFMKAFQDTVSGDFLSAFQAKDDILSNSRKLKEEVHMKIAALIYTLKQRELDLCLEIDNKCYNQMLDIDMKTTKLCAEKIVNKTDINKQVPPHRRLVLKAPIDLLKDTIQCFGELRHEDAAGILKKKTFHPEPIKERKRVSFSLDEGSPTTSGLKDLITNPWSDIPAFERELVQCEGNLNSKLNSENKYLTGTKTKMLNKPKPIMEMDEAIRKVKEEMAAEKLSNKMPLSKEEKRYQLRQMGERVWEKMGLGVKGLDIYIPTYSAYLGLGQMKQEVKESLPERNEDDYARRIHGFPKARQYTKTQIIPSQSPDCTFQRVIVDDSEDSSSNIMFDCEKKQHFLEEEEPCVYMRDLSLIDDPTMKQKFPTKLYYFYEPKGCTDADILSLFGSSGSITESDIEQRFGFVCMRSPEKAAMAVKELNNKKFGDSSLFVTEHPLEKEESCDYMKDSPLIDDTTKKQKVDEQVKVLPSTTLFFTLEPNTFVRTNLRIIFEQYDKIKEYCVFMKYGLVHMKTPIEAAMARKALNKHCIRGFTLNVVQNDKELDQTRKDLLARLISNRPVVFEGNSKESTFNIKDEHENRTWVPVKIIDDSHKDPLYYILCENAKREREQDISRRSKRILGKLLSGNAKEEEQARKEFSDFDMEEQGMFWNDLSLDLILLREKRYPPKEKFPRKKATGDHILDIDWIRDQEGWKKRATKIEHEIRSTEDLRMKIKSKLLTPSSFESANSVPDKDGEKIKPSELAKDLKELHSSVQNIMKNLGEVVIPPFPVTNIKMDKEASPRSVLSDLLPCEEFRAEKSLEEDLKELCLLPVTNIKKNEESSTIIDSASSKEAQADNSLEKDSKELSQLPEINIKKDQGVSQSSESTDSLSSEEVDTDSSLEKESELPVTDLKKDEEVSQSSESSDPLSSEVDKDSSLDEEDIEIISKKEAESIPLEFTFPVPSQTKNRIKSLRVTLLPKKKERKTPRLLGGSGKSESSSTGESDSQGSSRSGLLSVSDTGVKKKTLFKKQAAAKYSSKSLGASKNETQDKDLTAALRSSFTKYLEKNTGKEWLATEWSKPMNETKLIKISAEELEQWLPKEYNQKSDEAKPSSK